MPHLHALSLPWTETNPLAFLRRAEHHPRIYWQNERHPLAFAGFGAAIRLHSHSPNRFTHIQHQTDQLFADMSHWRDENAPPQVQPRLFGGFAFTPKDDSTGAWADFPPAEFFLPQYLLTLTPHGAWITVSLLTPEKITDPHPLYDLLWQIPPHHPAPPPSPPLPPPLANPFDDWQNLIQRAHTALKANHFQKVVLARRVSIALPAALDPLPILEHLRARYPDCCRFLYQPQPERAFLGATPELLAELDGETLHTMALAGSAPRGETYEHDETLGEHLLASDKNRREHALVVQQITQTLQPHARSLHLPPQPHLLKLSNIQHLYTPIRADLNPNTRLLSLIADLHPTPAVGGLPAQPALDFITTHEPHPRGWYAAPIGYLAPNGSGLFAVALRSALLLPHTAYLYAGVGILPQSDPAAEWHETELKFQPMLRALNSNQH